MGKGPNSQHNKNQKACDDLLNTNQHIEPPLLGKTEEEIKNNKLRLKTSIDAVRWLAFQNFPFRGHDESENSKNQGNFLKLIKFIASYNKDVNKVVLQNTPGNASYTSSTIQKEILQILAKKVQDKIRKEIGESKFCVILDESQDRALREQMAIVLRFVDHDGILKERFFDLVHVKNTSSLTLQQKLFKVLSYHNLNPKNIRGHGYYGASNMRGEFNGLKALILKDSPYAYYVHCFSHRLQLALVGATKEVIPIQQFFTKLAIIVNIVDASSKRHDELQATQKVDLANKIANDEVQTGRGLNQIGNLQRAADTRWTSHLNSINNLVRTFSSIGKVLLSIVKEGNSEQRANADNAYDTLILTGWDDLFQKVKSFCEKNNVQIQDMTTLYTAGKGRSRQGGKITMEHHYRVDLFIAASDSQLQDINNRFDEQMIDLLILSATLDPKDSFKSFDVDKICYLVQKHYPEDFSEQEKYQLESTCERAFSAMNIVKTQLRSKMEDDFLRDVLVVYIEKEIAVEFSVESLIDDFATMKNRRVRFN
ncbi:uncharacterized protein LOC110686799 [Chenopodium quinoa]|uniref:uncharacterized protein LOC110686799 n=1 Tax=Chenopodium quinoa TaxID=63459 RepID=UPI000B78BBC0|nr:uncharacterized protein LOC110686799 [Chenopodium quinoa]